MRKVAALVAILGVEPNCLNGGTTTVGLARKTDKRVGVGTSVQLGGANVVRARFTAALLLWFLVRTIREIAALVTVLRVQPNVCFSSTSTLGLALKTDKWVGMGTSVQLGNTHVMRARSTAFRRLATTNRRHILTKYSTGSTMQKDESKNAKLHVVAGVECSNLEIVSSSCLSFPNRFGTRAILDNSCNNRGSIRGHAS